MNGGRSFRRLAVILIAVLPGLNFASAQGMYPTGPAAGQELANTLCSMRPAEDATWHGVMKISGRAYKTIMVPVTCQTTLGDSDWTVIYTAGSTNSPATERLVIHFSTNAPPQYLYTPASGQAKSPTGAQTDVPFGGSDFWLSDLGFEFYHWPDQNRLKGDMRRSRPCFVLESVNSHPATNSYGRVKVWIEKESGVPLEAEIYGADGGFLKKFQLGSVKKVNGRYQLKDMEISNEKIHSRTELVFDLDSK